MPPDTGLDRWTSLEYAIEWLTDGFVAYWQDDLDLALRRLRVERAVADIQDEIDRLVQASPVSDPVLADLWEKKKQLLQQLERGAEGQ